MAMKPDPAADIAIAGLQYLAQNAEELERFLALTGTNPAEIRNLVTNSGFLVAILDYLLGSEPSLLAFSAGAKIDPADVKKARFALAPPAESEIF